MHELEISIVAVLVARQRCPSFFVFFGGRKTKSQQQQRKTGERKMFIHESDVSRAECFLSLVFFFFLFVCFFFFLRCCCGQPILPQDEKERLNYTSIKIFHVNRAMNFQFPFMHHVRVWRWAGVDVVVAVVLSVRFFILFFLFFFLLLFSILSNLCGVRALASSHSSAVFRGYLLHVCLISRRRIIIIIVHFLGGST